MSDFLNRLVDEQMALNAAREAVAPEVQQALAEAPNPLLELRRSVENVSGWDRRSFETRDQGTGEYAWAIPNVEALQTIAKYAPLIEMGAGRGYWASLLQRAGVHIDAFDPFPPAETENPYTTRSKSPQHQFTTVAKGGCEVLQSAPATYSLFLSWPPYDEPFAYECLKAFRGPYVIFVGESHGGCTGDDNFFGLLEAMFDEVERVDIPQWSGIHDYLSVWERKANPEPFEPGSDLMKVARFMNQVGLTKENAPGFAETQRSWARKAFEEWEDAYEQYLTDPKPVSLESFDEQVGLLPDEVEGLRADYTWMSTLADWERVLKDFRRRKYGR